jgi:hypothetical protein
MKMQIESNQSTSEFDEFVASGEVEVGDANAGVDEGDEKEKSRLPKRGPPKPAAKPAAAADDDEGDDQGDEGDDEGDDEGEDKPKPKKTAAEHQIERLKREKRDLQRSFAKAARVPICHAAGKYRKGLSGGNSGDNQNAGTPAPDPSDTAKYPLGHLDDRYIEDKLEWLADQKATKLADSALQRQQENERNAAINAHQQGLLNLSTIFRPKAPTNSRISKKRSSKRACGEITTSAKPTFEACAEADNGPQILYDLSQDTKEASRVAKLTPYGQLKFVQERDAEISAGKKGRTKPKAGDPPKNLPRGANSKTTNQPGDRQSRRFRESLGSRREEK